MYNTIKISLMVIMIAFASTTCAQLTGCDGAAIQLKSEDVAMELSRMGTLAPIGFALLGIRIYNSTPYMHGLGEGLIIAGITMGPSLGYFYGGLRKRGAMRAGQRLGLVMATYLLHKMASNKDSSDDPLKDSGLKETVFVIGASIITIHAIYDILEVRNSVREHNNQLINQNQTSVILTPRYFANSGTGGLELRINF